ncbi:hypothetical protein B0I72DRAFT_94980 [Yarrowia lipolytica]|jgi:hypothetical protein|uniref:MAGE domain-containing protein n=1 Tax=Yarrowia lipolytica TaxID=4952 RepID=A0A371CAT1_YARLL|nr:Hypothetical protein YALI2_D00086g [Yarrowia lipolytica]RDW27414.1 hypothetical protein B0I71DRAFT_94505 [Yarrowia lipolytica]RDW33723.1 hypothetical protein B0I72DRAFT_94980 [Yarrowia lipolytica]RDW40449.1 hypothetical protein B0I73DRAFT_95981 [Yarrowia lipolytica]RDW48710.1 hypothetical protein B0I74DRAFT_133161 [Yarrowia lipolytica]
MRRPGEALRNNARAKRQIVDDDDDDDEYPPVKGEQGNDGMGGGDQDYDYGDDNDDDEEEDSKENVGRAKRERDVNGDGGGVIHDRATKELIRYMVGAHSQGRIITREKLEGLMISVKLFDEKESRKGQKLSAALEKCVPYLRNVFGYSIVRFDKTFLLDPAVVDFKDKEFVLQTCLPPVYNEANGSDYARAPVSDEVMMAYVVACLAGLVVNMGVADYPVLSQYVTSVGLGQCLHKGKLKGADEMIGLLCKNDYLNLFPIGGAALPMAKKEVGAAKPSAKNVVIKDCKDLGLGHRDPEKAEIALGPKMYYEFNTLAVLSVFETINGEPVKGGLEKKIKRCCFGGPALEEQEGAEGAEEEVEQFSEQ